MIPAENIRRYDEIFRCIASHMKAGDSVLEVGELPVLAEYLALGLRLPHSWMAEPPEEKLDPKPSFVIDASGLLPSQHALDRMWLSSGVGMAFGTFVGGISSVGMLFHAMSKYSGRFVTRYGTAEKGWLTVAVLR